MFMDMSTTVWVTLAGSLLEHTVTGMEYHFCSLFLSVLSATCENTWRVSMEFRNVLRFAKMNLP